MARAGRGGWRLPGWRSLRHFPARKVLPVAAWTQWAIKFRSWDRMRFPLPFGRGRLVFGAMITVPRHDWETMLPAIEDRADGGDAAGRDPAVRLIASSYGLCGNVAAGFLQRRAGAAGVARQGNRGAAAGALRHFKSGAAGLGGWSGFTPPAWVKPCRSCR